MVQYKEIAGGKYKYELTAEYAHALGFIVDEVKDNGWCGVYPRRLLLIAKGYQWDGATCCPDFMDKWLLRASLVHDCLCQLINDGTLPYRFRALADKELKRIAIEDGMNRWLAEIVYQSVRLYAAIKYRK